MWYVAEVCEALDLSLQQRIMILHFGQVMQLRLMQNSQFQKVVKLPLRKVMSVVGSYYLQNL